MSKLGMNNEHHEDASLCSGHPPYVTPLDLGQPPPNSALTADSILPILRKVGWHLLPLFFLLNFLNYLDRTNLAFASIQMSQDLNLTQSEFGTGTGVFFIGYALFQIPSQIALRSIGAPLWLATIVTLWGCIACGMAGVTGSTSFYITRLLLGVTEAGCFPATWYCLTQFYPDKYITLPFSITDSAIMVAQVCVFSGQPAV
jgi:MFS family permease